MLDRTLAAGLALMLPLMPAFAAVAEVTVTFVDRQHYTGAGGYGGGYELRTLERHLTTQGQRCLAPGEKLELQVLDVDLAGRREWWHGRGYDARVMREITWPRLDLAYVWRDDTGKVLREGKARVADQNYLWRSAYVSGSADELPYEKAMLRDWFDQTFCPGRG